MCKHCDHLEADQAVKTKVHDFMAEITKAMSDKLGIALENDDIDIEYRINISGLGKVEWAGKMPQGFTASARFEDLLFAMAMDVADDPDDPGEQMPGRDAGG